MYDPYRMATTSDCESVARPYASQFCGTTTGVGQATYWDEERICADGKALKLLTQYSNTTQLPTGNILFCTLTGVSVAAPATFTMGVCQAATTPDTGTATPSISQQFALVATTDSVFRHNLGKAPDVQLINNTGQVIHAAVEHVYEAGNTLTNEVRVRSNQALNGFIIIYS